MPTFRRQAIHCETGTSWYTCNATGYKGCCSVDACYHGGCPDDSEHIEPSITITASLEPAAASTSTKSALTSFVYLPTNSPTQTRQTGSSSSISLSSSNTRSISSGAPSLTAQSTSIPSEQAQSSTTHLSKSSGISTPMIAGAVCGIVVTIVAAISLWFCIRKRRAQRLSPNSSTVSFAQSKTSYTAANPRDDEEQVGSSDTFVPFSEYKKLSSKHARAGSDATISPEQIESFGTASYRPQNFVTENAVCDLEKSSFKAPPIYTHPALHIRLGESPQIQSYYRGEMLSSPDLAPRPIHVADHPSSRKKEAGSYSRPQSKLSFPFRRTGSTQNSTSEETDQLSMLPSQRRSARGIKHALQRRSYVLGQPVRESPFRGPRKVKSFPQPITLTYITSPIAGRSELPAVVPLELPSTPVSLGGSFKEANPVQAYANSKELKDSTRVSSMVDLGFQPTLYRGHNQQVMPARGSVPVIDPSYRSPQSPEYYPSPQSAESPSLSSPFYQTHVVSPDTDQDPVGNFVGFNRASSAQPHISRMQSRSPIHNLRSNTPTPPPHMLLPESIIGRSVAPPPLLRVNTSLSTTSSPPPKSSTHRHSRSPILRSQAQSREQIHHLKNKKSTVGQEKDHATAWSKYEDAGSISGHSVSGSSKRSVKSHHNASSEGNNEEDTHGVITIAAAPGVIGLRGSEKTVAESPILPQGSFTIQASRCRRV